MGDGARWSRRAVLLAGGALTLSACAPEWKTTTARPDVPIRLSTRWSGKPDGPLPRTGDEGVPIELNLAKSTASPSIVDGALVSNLPDVAGSAAYLKQELDAARVNRIGARFGFGAGDSSGAIALLAIAAGPAGASGHCHMSFGPDRWIAGVLTDNAVTEISTRRYSSPVPQDGRPVTADVWFRGSTVWVEVPDGSIQTLTDPRFGGTDGAIACWEFYKHTPASADTRFYETWAG